MYNIKTSNNKIRINCANKKMEDNLTIEFNGETTESIEVKGKPYEFDTFEKMEEFLRSDESEYGDVVKYTGEWGIKQYFQFGFLEPVPNDNEIYTDNPIVFNTSLTNDEVKQIITNANLNFNYVNIIQEIPFNEYIIFSGKTYTISGTSSGQNVLYESSMRISLISNDAFPGEYVIFVFEDDSSIPDTMWSSIDIPDLNISAGWNIDADALWMFVHKSIPNSTYDGVDVGLYNDKLTSLIGISKDNLLTTSSYQNGNYFFIDNSTYGINTDDKSTNHYRLIDQFISSGLLEATKNGTYLVKAFEKVNVNTPTYITVASESELPSDVPDGTIAIVEE